MNWRTLTLALRAPDDAGGGAAPAADAPPAYSFLPEGMTARPDAIPESFWEEGKGIKVSELLADHTRLTGAAAATREAVIAELRKDAPAAPTDYAFPADALPKGLSIKEDDPLMVKAREVLHGLGATPAQFEELARAYGTSIASRITDIPAETAKLGETGAQRIAAVDSWLASQLPEAGYRAIMDGISSAAGVEALETLMKKVGQPVVGAPGGGGGGAQLPTPDEAMALTKDPDYWKETAKGAGLRAKMEAFVRAGGKLPGQR